MAKDLSTDAAHLRPDFGEEFRDPKIQPYLEQHRPAIRQQLNVQRSRHPDWSEEWYVHVPGTHITWDPRTVPPGQVMDLQAFPTAALAESFAQETWRTQWKKALEDTKKPFINPRTEFAYSYNATSPQEVAAYETWATQNTLEGVLIITRQPPDPVKSPPHQPRRPAWDEGLEDIETSAVRAKRGQPNPEADWEDRVRGHGPDAAGATPEAPWVASRAPVAVDATPQERDQAPWILWNGDKADPVFWTPATGRAPLITQVKTLDALQQRLPSPHTVRPGDPLLPEEWQSLNHARQQFVKPLQPAYQQWLDHGRAIIKQAYTDTTTLSAKRDVEAVVRTMTQLVHMAGDEGTPWSASTKKFVSGLNTVPARLPETIDPALKGAVQQWVEHGHRMTRDSLGLFATGRTTDAYWESVDTEVIPDSLEATIQAGSEWQVHRLPSGQFLRWKANNDNVPGVSTHPAYVDTTLFPTLDAVQEVTANEGATLTVANHAAVPDQWIEQLKKFKKPEEALRIIAQGMDPKLERVQQQAKRLARFSVQHGLPVEHTLFPDPVRAPAPATQYFCAPYGSGQAVIWGQDAEVYGKKEPPRPYLVAADPKTGAFRPFIVSDNPNKKIVQDPLDRLALLNAPAGTAFTELLAQAQTQWPDAHIQPALLPAKVLVTHLAEKRDVLPRPFTHPKETLWQISLVPAVSGLDAPQAVAWTREPAVKEKIGKTGDSYLESRLATHPLSSAKTGTLAVFNGTTVADALQNAQHVLQATGALTVSTPALPEDVAALAVGMRIAQEPRVLHKEPAGNPWRIFEKLDREAQQAIQDSAPGTAIKQVIPPRAYDVPVRSLSAYQQVDSDLVAGWYKKADQHVAAQLQAHPEYRPQNHRPEVTLPQTPQPTRSPGKGPVLQPSF